MHLPQVSSAPQLQTSQKEAQPQRLTHQPESAVKDSLLLEGAMPGLALCAPTRSTPGVDIHHCHPGVPQQQWQKVPLRQDMPYLFMDSALWVVPVSHG